MNNIFDCLNDDANIIYIKLFQHDINKTNNKGMTPLMIACELGNINIVKELIKFGADINMSTKKGTTALIFALSRGHEDLAKFLLQLGCKINILCDDNPLSFWCIKFDTFKIFELLTSNSNDFRTTIDDSILLSAIEFNNEKFIKYMLNNLTFSKEGICEASINAAGNCNLNILKLLFDYKIPPVSNYIMNKKYTALVQSIRVQSLEKVKYLVEEKNFEVNLRDEENMTPLIRTSMWGNLEIFDYLVSNGADIHTKCGKYTCMHNAVKFKYYDLVIYLIEKGVEYKTVYMDKEFIRNLMNKFLLNNKNDLIDSFIKIKKIKKTI